MPSAGRHLVDRNGKSRKSKKVYLQAISDKILTFQTEHIHTQSLLFILRAPRLLLEPDRWWHDRERSPLWGRLIKDPGEATIKVLTTLIMPRRELT
jgi:hypothetical protein